MGTVKVKVGTRESQLALWQTKWVAAELAKLAPDVEFEFEHIRTKGDKILDTPLAKIGDRGLFVKEIEEALAEGRVDIAVHSMKDVPTVMRDGLCIAAMPERVDARDCLLSRDYRSLRELPEGARVGTSSLRRIAQLSAYRSDLVFEPIRGNLDTRINKLETQGLAGVVLATAGLERLGWTELVVEKISTNVCLPAVGQGALGIQTRADDHRTMELVRRLSHRETEIGVRAERSLMAALEGGCQVPIGALAQVKGDEVELAAVVASLDGKHLVRGFARGSVADPEETGSRLAERLLKDGAAEILQAIRS